MPCTKISLSTADQGVERRPDESLFLGLSTRNVSKTASTPRYRGRPPPGQARGPTGGNACDSDNLLNWRNPTVKRLLVLQSDWPAVYRSFRLNLLLDLERRRHPQPPDLPALQHRTDGHSYLLSQLQPVDSRPGAGQRAVCALSLLRRNLQGTTRRIAIYFCPAISGSRTGAGITGSLARAAGRSRGHRCADHHFWRDLDGDPSSVEGYTFI